MNEVEMLCKQLRDLLPKLEDHFRAYKLSAKKDDLEKTKKEFSIEVGRKLAH